MRVINFLPIKHDLFNVAPPHASIPSTLYAFSSIEPDDCHQTSLHCRIAFHRLWFLNFCSPVLGPLTATVSLYIGLRITTDDDLSTQHHLDTHIRSTPCSTHNSTRFRRICPSGLYPRQSEGGPMHRESHLRISSPSNAKTDTPPASRRRSPWRQAHPSSPSSSFTRAMP